MKILDAFAQEIYLANKDKGFWETPLWAINDVGHQVPHTKPEYLLLKKMEKLGLIVTEVAEGMEGVRKPGPSEHIPEFTKEEEELADVAIRLFDYAGGFNLRLAEAIEAKLKFNANRPHKHGKAF